MNTTTAPEPSDRPDAPTGHGTGAARLPSFRTPVRGHAFAPRRPDTPDLEPGEPAELVPEPGNPADPHAIAVWTGQGPARRRIGYLDRGVAARVAPRLRDGVVLTARLEGWTGEPEGRWQRPMVLLTAASLPQDRTDRGRADRPGRTPGPTPPGHLAPAGGVWGRPPGVARRTLGPAASDPGISRTRAR